MFNMFQSASNKNAAQIAVLKQTPLPDIGKIKDPNANPPYEWKNHPVDFNAQNFSESLVPLGIFAKNFAHSQIFTDSIYFGQHQSSSPYARDSLEGALLTQFVRKSVADKLAAAASMLPNGMELMVWDAYRPQSVQQSLYDHCFAKIQTKNPDWNESNISEAAQKLVSIPSTDPTRPSPHNTGGSVDVTIIQFTPEAATKLKGYRKELKGLKAEGRDSEREYELEMKILDLFRTSSKPLEMGVRFDEETSATPMRHYEERAPESLDLREIEALQNRRLLGHIMRAVGFSVYEHEPWHFDSGNQFDGVKTAKPAVYGMASLSLENEQHEKLRLAHLKGTEILQQNPYLFAASVDPNAVLARDMAHQSSAFTQAELHPMAQKL